MNCQCNPPRPAVTRISQKQNANQGKEFFCCSTNGCNFFHWVGAPMPASLNRFRPQRGSPVKSNPSNAVNSNGPIPPSEHKVMIYEIVDQVPMQIWLYIQGPNISSISRFLSNMPPDKCRYDNGLKFWLFEFSLYKQVVKAFRSAGDIYFDELPSFLVKGLQNYLEKLSTKSTACEDSDLRVPAELFGLLKPFQKESLRFVIRHGGRALLGDEMGE